MRTISCQELKAKMNRHDKFILINALSKNRFAQQHIPGSINLSQKADFDQYLKKNDQIVVYCTDRSCNRSIVLAYYLESLGYTNVLRFAGGLRTWAEAGFELVDTVQTNIVHLYRSSPLRMAQ